MLPLHWRSNARLAVAAAFVLTSSGACNSIRQGYFQPQSDGISRLSPTPSNKVSRTDTVRATNTQPSLNQLPQVNLADNQPVIPSGMSNPAVLTHTQASSFRHHNPESRQITRFRRLLSPVPIDHVAPRRQTAVEHHSPARKTHPLAWVALGIAGLAYIPVLLAGASILSWVLSLTLPLAAVLLGVASLTTINRNKDRFRGKGLAMAAVLLGTGVLGLALVALAALSVSNVVREKK